MKTFNRRYRPRNNTVDDMAALRAFVMPELYPFLLDAYRKDGKNEEALRADIHSAREKYKELCAAQKTAPQPVVTSPAPNGPDAH